MPVLMLRHGPTALNNPDRSKDRIRGWIDLPLSPEGLKVAKKAAEDLADVALTHIYSSDLTRAATTAKLLGKATGAKVTFHKELRPWNLGAIQGKHSNDAQPLIDRLVAHPDVPAPGKGESFRQFLERYLPFVAPLVDAKALVGVVSHIRNIKALEAWLAHPERAALDEKTWKAAPIVQPGEAILATPKGVKKVETQRG